MTTFVLCLQIFFARILDVSLGTTRMILTVKGKALFAGVIGFVELFIWFVIAREAINTGIDSIWVPISYAGGYATGTFIGGLLSHKFISGNYGVQVVLSGKADEDIVNNIRQNGFAVSVVDVKGKGEHHNMLFIEINKNSFGKLKKMIRKLDEKAFMVVNETKLVQNGFVK
ncbi:MAG: DUF5698 domain-containing protein [Deltaproteobacteria bacterium]|jgi:uncharacterized protein YebE (UPF0316 family)|nr:DUF5698 domain-containing protein [Deltaproteobacteria bacterium]